MPAAYLTHAHCPHTLSFFDFFVARVVFGMNARRRGRDCPEIMPETIRRRRRRRRGGRGGPRASPPGRVSLRQ